MVVSCVSSSRADTIVLTSGTQVSGQLVEKTDEYIELDVSGARVTYYSDEIASFTIDESGAATAPEPASQQTETEESTSAIEAVQAKTTPSVTALPVTVDAVKPPPAPAQPLPVFDIGELSEAQALARERDKPLIFYHGDRQLLGESVEGVTVFLPLDKMIMIPPGQKVSERQIQDLLAQTGGYRPPAIIEKLFETMGDGLPIPYFIYVNPEMTEILKAHGELFPMYEDESFSYGRKDVPITLVMFCDFHCPGCMSAFPEAKRLVTANPDRIRLVYKFYPLQYERSRGAAAKAALAAGKQGKFFEMVELMHKNAPFLTSEAKFFELAAELQLDEARFREEYADKDEEFKRMIERDLSVAHASRVGGTPAFFINGEMTPYQILDKTVDRFLKAQKY